MRVAAVRIMLLAVVVVVSRSMSLPVHLSEKVLFALVLGLLVALLFLTGIVLVVT